MDICLDQTQQSLKKVCLDLESWGKGNNSYDGVRYDWKKRGFVKIQLAISSQNDQIKYIKNDGQIIRIDKFIGTYKTQEIMTNFEQIYHLQWQGAYNEDIKKIGVWRAFWKGAQLTDVGGSYENGKKFGLWKELFKNYWDKAQVYEIGEYTKNYRKGVWKLQYRENIIGGGEYNEHGEKTGIWIDLSDDFSDSHQITFKGQYQNSQKIGLWKIFKETRNENFELIGGGSYNESGQKNGQWEELNSNFNQDDRVYYIGEYLNGLKVGRWNINQRVEKGDEEMAGGCYNEQGLKEGMWLDLSPEFQQDGKIFHQGNYNDGKKIGWWKTIYRNQSIGGGLYDKQELKVGLWIELIDHSWNKNQVMYHGEYVNGKKFGRWDISFKEERKDRPELIGGGRYDEQGCKIGKWVDLIDNFNDTNQATYNGEYINGKKQGVWDLMYLNQLIGGGSFDEESLKHGKWIDQSDNLGANNKVTLEGSYFHGKRIDKWKWNYKMPWENNAQIMWGGFYDQEQQKDGQWLDLQENFENINEIFYQGGYKNGRKEGKWDIKFRQYFENDLIFIGSGQYDQDSQKNGQWVDLSENFNKDQNIIFTGQYQNGKKFGKWEIQYKNDKIGGGSYDELDMKNGVWIEVNDDFNKSCKILNSGEYINGKKIGKWDTKYKGWVPKNYEQIGGGYYSQEGLKIGKWIVLSENFTEESKVIYQGEYQNGKQKGKWSIKYRERWNNHYEEIGSGQFDDQGLKNGQWIVLSDHFSDKNQLVYLGVYLNGKKVGKWVEQKLGQKSTLQQIKQ